jgi:hypothetical protein
VKDLLPPCGVLLPDAHRKHQRVEQRKDQRITDQTEGERQGGDLATTIA